MVILVLGVNLLVLNLALIEIQLKSHRETKLYIMRRNSCKNLETVNCKKLKAAPLYSGIYGAEKMLRCFREPEKRMPCPLICKGYECGQY